MAKSSYIDFSRERLLSIAESMTNKHDYIGALKMLNKNAEEWGDDEVSLSLYADIYDDMELYDKSINGWFKFMDVAEDPDMSECYEGLATGFMNTGNEPVSAFYYNKLLFECEKLDAATRAAILKDYLTNTENPLKFVYPPALADCTDIIHEGIERMRNCDYDGAIEIFEQIDEENRDYSSARNYIAMCKVISERAEEAEQECMKILQKNPDDVQALTTLAAVKAELGRDQEALMLANRLMSLNVTDPEEIYKIATVCCENKMHAQAYEMFCQLPEEYSYDLTALYFKAVSAYNSGKYEESFNLFDSLLTIYPEAVTARYYYNFAREMHENGEHPELSYFYRLPQEVRESTLKVLAAYNQLSKTQAKKLASELNLFDCIMWCFDEREDKAGELPRLGAFVAVKAGFDDVVRNVLLDAYLPEKMKMEVVGLLAERNKNDCFGVVLCNIHKRISTAELKIGRYKKRAFVKAYACLVSHFSALNDEFGARFAATTESLYAEMEKLGTLDRATNHDVLTTAIYVKSGVREAGITGNKIYPFFSVTKEQVARLTEKS